MSKIVGIQFKRSGKVYDFASGHFVLKRDDKVMVITDEGPAIGRVCTEPRTSGGRGIPKRPLKEIYRLATKEEIERFEKNCRLEDRIFEYCCKKIEERSIPMCLASVERSFESGKIVVYFTAGGRVDFRDLVKDLVGEFRTRIEMRQIGVRQHARTVGGLGPCGGTLCCATFLNNFAPVTVKMAKEQNLSLNPSKISGMCGRLMCCLTYEREHYEEIKKNLPKIGKKVVTKDGEGKVTRQDVLKKSVFVTLESGNEIEVQAQDLIRQGLFKKKIRKDN